MALRTYDMHLEETRDVTQDDVDMWHNVYGAFGLLMEFMRKSSRGERASGTTRIRDGEARSVALAVGQGRLSVAEGSKALTLLLELSD